MSRKKLIIYTLLILLFSIVLVLNIPGAKNENRNTIDVGN